jgi:hypothetical protein
VKVCLFFFLQWRKEDGGVVSGFFRGKEEVAGVRMIMVRGSRPERRERGTAGRQSFFSVQVPRGWGAERRRKLKNPGGRGAA